MHQLEFMNRNFIFNLLVRNNRYGISLWVFNAISYKWAQESVMHQLEFKNRNFIFTCKKHNLLCCLLNILVTLFLTIFQRFPNTFGKFLKIPIEEDFRGLTQSVSTHFPKNYKDYQSSEDNWRLPKISNQDPMMFWSYINTFKCNFKGLIIKP